MPRSVSTSSRDIDSLPYHALQAEAAKYSIRRNLGSAKLKIAIKRVQETGGDTKDLPREWLTVNATESIEVSTGIIPTTILESRNTRKIISKPKPSINSQRQDREKGGRLPSTRVPSRTIKRVTSSDSDVIRKTGSKASTATNIEEPAKPQTSTSLSSNDQTASVGPSVKQNEDLTLSTSSQEVSSQEVNKPSQTPSVSQLEKAICQKALEMGIEGGVPTQTVQCLMEIISEVLLGLLSGTAMEVAVNNVLKLNSRSLLSTDLDSPRTNSKASSNPTPTSSGGQNVEPESQGESVQPAGDLAIDCISNSIESDKKAPAPEFSPKEQAKQPDQTSVDKKSPNALRRKIREVDNVENPPMKKTKTCFDETSSAINPTEDNLIPSEPQEAIDTTDTHKDTAVLHTNLSPIKEDPQSESNSPRRSPINRTASNTLTNENLLPSTNSKVNVNIFPTNHTRLIHRPVKASGISSPLSKPTLYGTEHMYGHSTAPFGELYDNTDMSFLYELTKPSAGVGDGSSKH